jgi:uncharacterized protein
VRKVPWCSRREHFRHPLPTVSATCGASTYAPGTQALLGTSTQAHRHIRHLRHLANATLRTPRLLLFAVAIGIVIVLADVRRPPAEQLTSRAAVVGIHAYQATLSRAYDRMGVRCRFTPTCSHYGEACIRQFGAARGGWMALKRVLRCGPWTPAGTVDPPPIAVSVPSHTVPVLAH